MQTWDEEWQYFAAEALLYTYDLETKVMTSYKFKDSHYFIDHHFHGLLWQQSFPRGLDAYRIRTINCLQFCGGRVNVSRKNYIQFCLPEFNHFRNDDWFAAKDCEHDEKTLFEGMKPWDKSDTFSIEDNWWKICKGL